MNRAQRREHGHLLDRVCARCRTRLRLITRYIPGIQYPVRFESELPNWQAICDDCGAMQEMTNTAVTVEGLRRSLVTEAHFERDREGEMRVYCDAEVWL